MTNQTPEVYESGLAKINNTYLPQIENQLNGNGIQMTEYQRTVVINALSAINELMLKEGTTITNINQNNITQTLLTVAALQLNAAATPREVYFIIRNQKYGKDKNAEKIPVLEMGIEGDGNDALLARFGRNVKTVHRHWEVRENDQFTYPSYSGLEIAPPTWSPTGEGKVVRVVYPIEYIDGRVEFFIVEREKVKDNLLAHISNNMMYHGMGIVEKTYGASYDDQQKVAAKKKELKKRLEGLTLEQIIEDEELDKFGLISPAWKEPQSRETMIVRKMRNRIVKKIPKDFSNAYIQSIVESIDDDFAARQVQRKEAEIVEEINENANSEVFEPDSKELPESTQPVDTAVNIPIYETEAVENVEESVGKVDPY